MVQHLDFWKLWYRDMARYVVTSKPQFRTSIFGVCNQAIIVKQLGARWITVGRICICFEGMKLIFDAGHLSWEDIANGIYNGFVKQEYGSVDVLGRDVVDVGLTFGDSLVYFIAKGAKHVTGIEADPAFTSLSSHNVMLNGMAGSCNVLNVFISNVDGYGNIDFADNAGVSTLRHSGNGIAVNIMKPESMIKNIQLHDNAVLKMDCEGCEYHLMATPGEMFDIFDDVILEYHSGYESLVKHFRPLGFRLIRKSGPYQDSRQSAYGIIHLNRSK